MNKDIYICRETTHSLNTNNGILNKANLEYAKKKFISEVIKDHLDLVKTKQHYPNNDLSDVDMKLDFVIVDTKRYNKLIQLEALLEEEQEKYKYIKFPKLEV